jgi:hypothetical protein
MPARAFSTGNTKTAPNQKSQKNYAGTNLMISSMLRMIAVVYQIPVLDKTGNRTIE